MITIDDAWSRLGLQGSPSKSCKAPHREDRSASFSVFDGGRAFNDFATGDCGDVVSFVSLVTDMDSSAAAKWLIESAGTARGSVQPKLVRRPRVEKPRPEPMPLPQLDKGTVSELHQLQELRGLEGFWGLQILSNRGQLFFCDLPDNGQVKRCWIITDDSRRNAQARPLDGSVWDSIGGAKAKTLKGYEARWPIGASAIKANDTVLFCEGGPDLLAAATAATYDLGNPWSAVCMTGSADIIPDALPQFKGKEVMIFVHNDAAGIKAARRWAAQLTSVDATVTTLISEVERRDLNDALIAGEAIF
ncbi:toprim domain-containing protein [Puniceicoccaceae bacterium]|nr:toprim domain-containing protein [Puniceicoccaceae bacterium]